MQLQYKLYIDKIYIANIFQIERQAKSYTIEKEYYKYKNIIESRKRCNNNITYNAFNKFAKSILDNKSFEEKKRNQIVRQQIYRAFALKVFTI